MCVGLCVYLVKVEIRIIVRVVVIRFLFFPLLQQIMNGVVHDAAITYRFGLGLGLCSLHVLIVLTVHGNIINEVAKRGTYR